MPIIPAITIATSIDPSAITIMDVSTGSDGAIVSRQINLYQVDNSLLGASPYTWPLATNPITITPLDKDYALNVVVNYLDSGGNTLYTASLIFVFWGYTKLFLYRLTEAQASKPQIPQDTNYYDNKMQLFTEVESGQNAIDTGDDYQAAQRCVDRAFLLTSNANLYF